MSITLHPLFFLSTWQDLLQIPREDEEEETSNKLNIDRREKILCWHKKLELFSTDDNVALHPD